ncbi:MAG: hypothetical protein WAX80_03330 [Minisyncoccia bacterium]
MITLSNGHRFEYMVASGALGFDGRGWPWERPLVALGLIRPELFTVVLKSLTRHPRAGNLRWWKPWDCVRLIDGGSVNKVGLTNPGIDYWCNKIAPTISFHHLRLVSSIFGEEHELVEMATRLNQFINLVGLEVNVSCPNTGHAIETAETVVKAVRAVKAASHHPIIVKVSVDQDYMTIARHLIGIAEAISLNSVPWSTIFPNQRSPLWKLERKVGGGGGGVSGKPAQTYNWAAVAALSSEEALPVIGSSVMEREDIVKLRFLGASAVSFGAIHLRTPWRPTSFVFKETKRGKTLSELA